MYVFVELVGLPTKTYGTKNSKSKYHSWRLDLLYLITRTLKETLKESSCQIHSFQNIPLLEKHIQMKT